MADRMHGDGEHPGEGPGHERTDVSAAGILKFGAALVVGLVLMSLGLRWYLMTLERHDPEIQKWASGQLREREPPPPRLESSSSEQLVALRHDENERLSTYGWVDPKHKIVRVPIDRAMAIAARKGLPKWPPVVEKPAGEKDAGKKDTGKKDQAEKPANDDAGKDKAAKEKTETGKTDNAAPEKKSDDKSPAEPEK
jgi:hypothetical protein